MKTKKLVIALLSVLMLSGILMTTGTANTWPILPSDPVTLEITNMTPWTFPFDILLSDFPAGTFDVSAGTYTGWCVDVTHGIERGVEYDVKLYSSLSPPAEVSSVPWDIVNYILNNKDAGTGADIQDALWYFINGEDWYEWPPSESHTHTATAEAIVDDALTNGDGYTPGPGDILAIICLPQEPPTPRAQMLVIELTMPPPGLTPGFWKHNIGVALGENPGKYSAFPDGTKLSLTLLNGYAATVGVSLEDAYAALSARGNTAGQAAIRADMANAFNAAAGYGPFED